MGSDTIHHGTMIGSTVGIIVGCYFGSTTHAIGNKERRQLYGGILGALFGVFAGGFGVYLNYRNKFGIIGDSLGGLIARVSTDFTTTAGVYDGIKNK
ncbi:unnamed protein product [Adineta steineri]|uniref:Uncharacterized protein n=1 Tax=Adineta steineri TaxID=433720 RepID=A0A819PX45_9BILA|nr:unnamed protein product [Adineta steineri]CAF4017670.1 unnamed protein product [Adineta steineri]